MIENTISIDSTMVADAVSEDTAPETKVQNNDYSAQEVSDGFKATESAENGRFSDAETADAITANQQESTVELTIYGEKRQVPLSQAIIAAQKGMAFDHIKAQLAELKNDYRLKALDQVAQRQGKTAYQLVAELQHKAVADDLIERYGDFYSVPLEELGNAVETLAATHKQLADSKAAEDYHYWKNQLADFARENPGCREIPDEVISAAKKGENLTMAYSRIYGNKLEKQLKEAQLELDILKSESKAVRSSTPSAKGTAASKPKENEYLKLMKSTW